MAESLEIITPSGEIKFFDLDPTKGATNIGSHPDNDIVLPGAGVAPFHAVLLHGRRPFQLMALDPSAKIRVGGQALAPNVPFTLNGWETIELDGCSIIFVEGAPAARGPSQAAGAPRVDLPPPLAPATPQPPPGGLAAVARDFESSGETLAKPSPAGEGIRGWGSEGQAFIAPPLDRPDEVIIASLTQREFTIDVEQTASFNVEVVNGGAIVAAFEVGVEGIDPSWVKVSPDSINLFEGGRAAVNVSITPPRRPSSRAGQHYLALKVTSPNHPGRVAQMGLTLNVKPYYEYSMGEISPRQQRVGWTRRTGRASFVLANTGNSTVPFRLDAIDDEHACQFEFDLGDGQGTLARQAEVRLDPEEARQIGLTITPLKRRFFAFSSHTHSFTVSATPLEGQIAPRSALAQAVNSPLIGPWHVAALVLLLLIAIAIAFKPAIADFRAEPNEVLSSEIMAGKKVTLSWRASWFSRLVIDQNVGVVRGPQGSVQVAPLQTLTYRLTATNFLTFIYPSLFTATREQTVVVDPVTPIVRFSVDRDQIVAGESATLSWEVLNAESVVLKTNNAPETLPPEEHIGSRTITPETETTYELVAKNRYTGDEGIIQTIVVNATAPTPTPLPLPVIERFDAGPNPITAGDEVTLEWSVDNVEEITIEPLGSFPPVGKYVDKPQTTTTYQLIASNGQAPEVRSLREITVNPAPTATPVPGTPRIEFFTASPTSVNVGSAEQNNIQLAWAVTGDTTNIELNGDTIGRVSGLEKQGTRVVAAGSTDTTFTLTAYNGALNASQQMKVTVTVPVPLVSGVNPSSKYVGEGAFTLTVTGANFVHGATVRWNGVDRMTNFVSTTQLTAAIPASDISKTGTYSITVFNPASAGGGQSGAVNFNVNNPTPSLTAVDPNFSTADVGDVTITVTGKNFVSTSKVRWNGADLVTTYINSTTLTAVIPRANQATADIYTINVFNPEPVGGLSGALPFTVNNPVPTLTSLGPQSFAYAGQDSFNLTIKGTNFVGGIKPSQVSWNGDVRSAVFLNSTTLNITIPKEDLIKPGFVDVAVINPSPGGGPSNSMAFEIRRLPVTVNLSASPGSGSVVTGQAFSLTATVTPSSSTSHTVTGSVDFKIGSTLLGSAPLSSGAATINNVRLRAGTYNITATYLGDINFESKTSTPLNYVVNKADVTVTVSSSSSETTYGDNVTFTATLGIASPGSGTVIDETTGASITVAPASGSVQFMSDFAPIGAAKTVPVGSSSIASDPINTLTAGTHSISASYTGGSADPYFANGASPTIAQNVAERTPTTAFTAASGTSTYGDQVTFNLTVSYDSLSPSTGTITLYNDGAFLGTAFLSAGTASYQTNAADLTPGTHSITAKYNGEDPNFLASPTSAPRAQTVNKRTPTLTLINSVTNDSNGFTQDTGLVTWTAMLSVPAGLPTPTGIVEFTLRTNYDTDHCHSSWWHTTRWYIWAGLSGGTTSTAFVLVWNDGANQMQAYYQGDSNYTSANTYMTSNTALGVTCVNP